MKKTHILIDEKTARKCGIASPMNCNADGLTSKREEAIRNIHSAMKEENPPWSQGSQRSFRNMFPETFPVPEPVERWKRTDVNTEPKIGEYFEGFNGEPTMCGQVGLGPRWILRRVLEETKNA